MQPPKKHFKKKRVMRPRGRPVNGVLLLDKPKGVSSNAALQSVKQLFSAQKAGHSGSLDPLASGMLPVCFGEATKFSQFLLNADKRYHVIAKLGVKTTTGDAEGSIISERSCENVNEKILAETLEKFRGVVSQVPSMYSALKHQGQPLYKLARQGIEVERPSREVNIYALEMLAFSKTDNTVTLNVHCSKGTYVRTLVEDIGEVLGCGGHVAELRRLSAGPYEEAQMISLETIEEILQKEGVAGLDQLLLSIDSSVQQWPELMLTEASAFYVNQGQPVLVPRAPTSGWVRLLSRTGEFLGVGEIQDDGKVAPRRLLAG